MALAASALTTLATVRDELGIVPTTFDTILERMINAVSDAFAKEADRVFQSGVAITERVRGYGTERIIINRVPVTVLTSVELLDQDGTVSTTYDTDTFELESANSGIVYRAAGWPWTAQVRATGIRRPELPGTERRALRVTYDGGFVTPAQTGTRTLPFDIEEAVIRAVSNLFRSRGTAAGAGGNAIASERLGDYAVSYEGAASGIWGGGGTVVLPPAVAAVARRYRRVL